MRPALLFCCCLWLSCQTVLTQNLVPNPSFEDMEDYDCTDPISGFVNLTDWYSWGTPHLFRYGCRYDRGAWRIITPSIRATEGVNSLSLIGALHVDGKYGSTTMAAPLTDALIPGQQYYHQFFASNRGVFHMYEDSLKVCDTDPARGISTYFGDAQLLDSIILAEQPPQLSFTSSELQDTSGSPWILFSDCFTADAPHSHIAIDQNRQRVNMSPPCEVRDIGQGLIYFGYHTRLDEVILYPVPERIDTTIISCTRQAFEMDVSRICRFPRATAATFDWDDGFRGPTRTLYNERTYSVIVTLPCTSFEVNIQIQRADCRPEVYGPTAFSPNADGQNDRFEVVVQEGFSLSAYRLSLYDRWGRLVWQTLDPTATWDGTIGGQAVQEGVYTWLLNLEMSTDHDRVQSVHNGTVMIIR